MIAPSPRWSKFKLGGAILLVLFLIIALSAWAGRKQGAGEIAKPLPPEPTAEKNNPTNLAASTTVTPKITAVVASGTPFIDTVALGALSLDNKIHSPTSTFKFNDAVAFTAIAHAMRAGDSISVSFLDSHGVIVKQLAFPAVTKTLEHISFHGIVPLTEKYNFMGPGDYRVQIQIKSGAGALLGAPVSRPFAVLN